MHQTSRTIPYRFTTQFVVASITLLLVGSVIAALVVALPAARTSADVAAVDGIVVIPEEYRGSVVSLTGEWHAWFDEQIDPTSPQTQPVPTAVPQAFPGESAITYRVTIDDLDPDRRYALYVTEIAAAARLFANGESIGATGAVLPDGSVAPSFVPKLFVDLPQSDTLAVVFEVTNRTHAAAGIWQGVYFGPYEEVVRFQNRLVLGDAMLIGAFLMIALYHLILATIYPGDGSNALLALFAYLVAVKSLLSGQQLFLSHIDTMHQIAWIRGAYGAIALAVPVLLAYTQRLFRDWFYPSVVRVALVLGLIQTILTAMLPFAVLQVQYRAWHAVTVIACVYVLVTTIRAVRGGALGGTTSLIGFLFLFAFGLNDILFDLRLVDTGFVLPIGLFGFILSQATVLALRYNALFRETAILRNRLEDEVAKRTEELQSERNRMEQLARHDDLTGLVNRRYAAELMRHEVERVRRYHAPISLLLVDIDHFKPINDDQGHQIGDDVLRGFADILQTTTRATDIVSRWGGEEFLLILPNTGGAEAENLAIKLQETVAMMPIQTRSGSIAITFSGGVAYLDPGKHAEAAEHSTVNEVIDALLRAADLALYAGKRGGRNLIRCSHLSADLSDEEIR